MYEIEKNYWCETCGKRIYEGDSYHSINDHFFCTKCAIEHLATECVTDGEFGGKVFLVNDSEWDMDELESLLRATKKVKRVPDEEEDNPFDEPEYHEERYWK